MHSFKALLPLCNAERKTKYNPVVPVAATRHAQVWNSLHARVQTKSFVQLVWNNTSQRQSPRGPLHKLSAGGEQMVPLQRRKGALSIATGHMQLVGVRPLLRDAGPLTLFF